MVGILGLVGVEDNNVREQRQRQVYNNNNPGQKLAPRQMTVIFDCAHFQAYQTMAVALEVDNLYELL